MEKTCIECGDEIRGRSDKKFCSDQCRNAYNNKLNQDANNLVRNVNGILKKNRRILQELNPGGKKTVHKDKLLEKGFNFNYLTGVLKTKEGKEYRFCYEHGYLELDNGFYVLVIRND